MDRRDFLKLMAQTGALAAMGGIGTGCGGNSSGTSNDNPLTHLSSGNTEPTVDYPPRNPDGHLTPYLVIPKLDYYHPSAPEWTSWAGAQLTNPPHSFWFVVPDINESTDVILPVINLGNMTTRHLILELYEGPHQGEMSLSQCTLVERKGPYTLHPGIITGYPMRFTRSRAEGASIAICYDPFFDPIHSIASVGALSSDRKNLGNCPGIKPPGYPGYYGF